MYTHTHTHTHTYIWINESLCCTPKTNTILQINYTSIKKKKQESGVHPDLQNQKLQGWVSTICVLMSLPGDLIHTSWRYTQFLRTTGTDHCRRTMNSRALRDDQSQRCQFTTHTCGQHAPWERGPATPGRG